MRAIVISNYLFLSLTWGLIVYSFIHKKQYYFQDRDVNIRKAVFISSLAVFVDSLYWFVEYLSYSGILHYRVSAILYSSPLMVVPKLLLIGAGITVIEFIRKHNLEDLEQQAEEIFQNAKNKFILDSIVSGVIAINEEGKIITYNKAAEKVFRTKAEQAIGMNYKQLLNQAKVNPPNYYLLKTLIQGITYDEEIWIHVGDEEILLSFSTSQITDNNGKVIGAATVFHDVTAERELEERVIRYEKLSVLGEIAAGTAHEIRNPLTTVKGFLQMIEEQIQREHFDRERLVDYCGIMLEEIDRANKIITEFLLTTKPQAPLVTQLAIESIIKDAVFLTENQALLQQVELTIRIEDHLPTIDADRDQIKQVLLNLICNAFEAMPNGGHLFIDASSTNNQVSVKIRDTGIGISKDNMKKIFLPFFTSKNGNSGKIGTGLGLSVCKNIIEGHRGTITVQSKEHEGSTFTIYLPKADQ